jgi:hypothetical protein
MYREERSSNCFARMHFRANSRWISISSFVKGAGLGRLEVLDAVFMSVSVLVTCGRAPSIPGSSEVAAFLVFGGRTRGSPQVRAGRVRIWSTSASGNFLRDTRVHSRQRMPGEIRGRMSETDQAMATAVAAGRRKRMALSTAYIVELH